MSNYTPTTDEVRMAYVLDPENPFFSSAADWTGEEFDRWLTEVKAEQDKTTTDRIIALLEADCFCQAPEDQHPCWPCQTIALIKGENK